MVRLYNFHIYSDEYPEQLTEIEEFKKSKVQISNSLGEDVLEQLMNDFDDCGDVSIANKIDPPGEKGGGYLGVFPLNEWIAIGLVVQIVLVTSKGFFDELGREFAKKLIKALVGKNKATKISISHNEKIVDIILPAGTKLKDIINLEKFLSNCDNTQEGKYVYSSKENTFVIIEKYNNFSDKG